MCADKFKVVFSLNTGPPYSASDILSFEVCGHHHGRLVLVWFLIVPLIGSVDPASAALSPEDIFTTYGRPIGIGA